MEDTMKWKSPAVLLLLFLRIVGDDNAVITGGACRYESARGAAVITRLDTVRNGSYQRVYFDFIPANSAEPVTGQRWMFDTSCIGDGPVHRGATFACIRTVCIEGVCTPLVYEFTNLDTACWYNSRRHQRIQVPY